MNTTLIVVNLYIQVLYIVKCDRVESLSMNMHSGQWLPLGSARTPAILDVIRELIIPQPSSMKIPSTLKCVGIELYLKQRVNLIRRGLSWLKSSFFAKSY